MTKWDLKLVTRSLLAIVVNVQVHILTEPRGCVTNLRSNFVIRVDFLAKKRELTGKTFTTTTHQPKH